jgi:hypothetical protein
VILPNPATGINIAGSFADTVRLGVGDFLQLVVYQDSAGNATCQVASLAATWMGP